MGFNTGKYGVKWYNTTTNSIAANAKIGTYQEEAVGCKALGCALDTATGILTINKSGIWDLLGNVLFNAVGTGNQWAWIGSTAINWSGGGDGIRYGLDVKPTTAGWFTSRVIEPEVYLAAGTNLALYLWQSSSVNNVTALVEPTKRSTYFGCRWVRGA